MAIVLDHRYREAQAALDGEIDRSDVDSTVAPLVKHLDKENPLHIQPIQDALHIYNNSFQKSVVESLLLGGATAEDTAKYLGITPVVIEMYLKFFFDLSTLESKLSKFEYVGNLPDGDDKLRKETSLMLGADYIKLKMGSPLSLDPEMVLGRLLTDAYTMARQSMVHANINSKSMKESYRWAALAAKIADSLAKKKTVESEQDFVSTLVVEPMYDGGTNNLVSDIELSDDAFIRG